MKQCKHKWVEDNEGDIRCLNCRARHNHLDVDFNPTFKERLGAIYKLMFYKSITFRFEWYEKNKKSNR